MPVGAIVVAAGRGERLGGSVPKQLQDLGGRSILRRSVEAFDEHAQVSRLVVVLPDEHVADGPTLVGPTERPCDVVAGGTRRQDSVASGLAGMPAEASVILVHDAARPFASAALIDRVIEGARRHGAAIPGVSVRDTVKRVDRGRSVVTETIPREELRLVQTPQGFRRDVLEAAVALGQRGVEATDEAMLAEQAGHSVVVVPGDEGNVKITTAGDLAEARGRLEPGVRVGTGFDLHRLVDSRPLVLAGVTLATDRGPDAHSDGDVLCHAVVDAMLGAVGAGDIGRHFPNTDPAWRDAAGLDLLARAVAIVHGRSWRVSSVDVTIIVEQPKLAPHVPAMIERVAGVLGLADSQVSVKGKTNEGVDAIGRGEAIAAHAVAVVTSGVTA
jgi:2-C-methyl-D-erythritol 4-phosphate cytidylyltransferase/2-C-methyl-D-erythritol 2,4-cyclodiphosphate synthase